MRVEKYCCYCAVRFERLRQNCIQAAQTGPATRLSSTHAMDRLDPLESLLLKASTGPGFDVPSLPFKGHVQGDNCITCMETVEKTQRHAGKSPVSTRSLCKGHWSPILELCQGNVAGEASGSRTASSMPSTTSTPRSSDP